VSELKLDRPWRKRVNVEILSSEARRILEKVGCFVVDGCGLDL
jgi:hypothetical protein